MLCTRTAGYKGPSYQNCRRCPWPSHDSFQSNGRWPRSHWRPRNDCLSELELSFYPGALRKRSAATCHWLQTQWPRAQQTLAQIDFEYALIRLPLWKAGVQTITGSWECCFSGITPAARLMISYPSCCVPACANAGVSSKRTLTHRTSGQRPNGRTGLVPAVGSFLPAGVFFPLKKEPAPVTTAPPGRRRSPGTATPGGCTSAGCRLACARSAP